MAPTPNFFRRTYRTRQNRFRSKESVEILRERLSRGITARRLFLQAFQTERFKIGRDAWIEEARSDGFFVHHILQRLGERLAKEGRAPGDQVIKNRAER